MARGLILLGRPTTIKRGIGEFETESRGWQVADGITLEWGVNVPEPIGPFPLDPTLEIIGAVFGDDDPLYDQLKDSFWTWGTKEECMNDPLVQDELRAVVRVIVPLPSPRIEIDDHGNEVTVTGGCEVMTMQEAIDAGKTWTSFAVPTMAGV
jgi:hypothetical protein